MIKMKMMVMLTLMTMVTVMAMVIVVIATMVMLYWWWWHHPSQEHRVSLLKQLDERKREKEELTKELEKYRECDPVVLEQVKKESVVAVEAANRWTGDGYSGGSDYSCCGSNEQGRV